MSVVAFPLAYHITWGTYGTRLHGDDRGTVYRGMNQFGDPIVGADREWQQDKFDALAFPPRVLTVEQRQFIEQAFRAICARGGWKAIAIAAATDHVHTFLSASSDGSAIRKWLKRWIGESLSERWPLLPKQSWWAECGSVKWVWTEDYYQCVIQYVRRQRATP